MIDFSLSDEEQMMRDTVRAFMEKEVIPLEPQVLRNEREHRPGLSPEQALGQVERMVSQQAFMLAANDIFYASAVLFLLLIPLVWLAHPTKASAGSADAAAGAH